VAIIILTALLGCSQDEKKRWTNKEAYQFVGTFENQYDDALLEFNEAKVVIIRSDGTSTTRDFVVKDKTLTILIRNSSKEKRENLIMRIHGQSELLTCASCAKHQLASIWQKRDFTPLPDK
jgi:hypothetical protein